MTKDLTGRIFARRFFFAVCLGLLATNTVFGRTTTERQLAIPAYGDSFVWGVYFRRLQDTTALRWHQEITYYRNRRAYSRGLVTARFTITPDGKIHRPHILSNTSNQPGAGAVVRALKKTWKPFPAEVAALAPSGLIVDQTSRYWNYDPTNHGWASTYALLLVGRSPEIGGAYNLDIRKYRDPIRFRHQSRIISVTPVGTKTSR